MSGRCRDSGSFFKGELEYGPAQPNLLNIYSLIFKEVLTEEDFMDDGVFSKRPQR